MKSRYQEKKQGAPKKKHTVKGLCRRCLSKHCHCKVDTSQHFRMDSEQIGAWYGEEGK